MENNKSKKKKKQKDGTYEYKKYYPHNDLAPLFRLSYYYQYDFLKNSLRSTAKQLYL